MFCGDWTPVVRTAGSAVAFGLLEKRGWMVEVSLEI